MPERPTGPFELRISADATHVATARLFVASLGRILGLGEETIDDLRLAVSEAVSAAIVRGDQRSDVVVSGFIVEEGLVVKVGPLHQGDESDDRFDVASIIKALFAETRFEQDTIVIPVGGPGE